jgi:DNA-binding CsgD family transcriptional regulator
MGAKQMGSGRAAHGAARPARADPRRPTKRSPHLTVREQAEREVAAHIAIAEALGAWEQLDSGSARLLGRLAEALDCQMGVLWVPRGDRLAPRAFWHEAAVDLGEFKVMTLTSRLPRGAELPGQAWQRLEPSGRSGADGPSPPRWRAAAGAGFRGAIAFPAIWSDEMIAVVELVSREELELTKRLNRSLTAIGFVLGQFLACHRGSLDERVITNRQVEVLELAAQGFSRRQIAERLVVSPNTVKTHFENSYARLGVNNRAAAVAEAIRLGLVD